MGHSQTAEQYGRFHIQKHRITAIYSYTPCIIKKARCSIHRSKQPHLQTRPLRATFFRSSSRNPSFSAFQEQLLNGFMETFLDKPVQINEIQTHFTANALPRVDFARAHYILLKIITCHFFCFCSALYLGSRLTFCGFFGLFGLLFHIHGFPCFLKPLSFYAFPPCLFCNSITLKQASRLKSAGSTFSGIL